MQKSFDLIVVGSGPAGLMTAISAIRARSILLIEKDQKNFTLGKRILVSGNGRANFFNEDLLENVPVGEEWSPFFAKGAGMKFLSYLTDRLGFTFRKEGKLYYPYFNRSECLHNTLTDAVAKDDRITVYKGKAVRVDGKKLVVNSAEGIAEFEFKKLVIATGGRSYDRPDFTGDLLKSTDVLFREFKPALCPVKTVEKIPKSLIKNKLKCRLVLKENGKPIYIEEGEVLFKKDGLSGICVFNASLVISQRENPAAEYTFELQYDGRCSKAAMPSFLSEAYPYKKLREGVLTYTFSDLYSFEESQVSYGGVRAESLNCEDFSMKERRDIHIIGECLDITLPCGGYNMGIALIEGFTLGGTL